MADEKNDPHSYENRFSSPGTLIINGEVVYDPHRDGLAPAKDAPLVSSKLNKQAAYKRVRDLLRSKRQS